MLMTVANCRRERIRCIFLRTIGELQDRRNHSLDLFFGRMTIPRNSMLDLHGTVLRYGQIALSRCEKCSASNLPQFQRTLGIACKKNPFDAHGMWLVLADHVVQFSEYPLDTGSL